MIKNLLTFFTQFISIILIPLLVPTYLSIIILQFFSQLTIVNGFQAGSVIVAIIIFITVLLPFIYVFILYKMGTISSLSLNKKEDRFLPQIAGCVLYIVASIVITKNLGYKDGIALCIISSTLSLIIISVITHFWKISAHMAGTSGMVAIVSMLMFKHYSNTFLPYYIILIFSMLFLAFARIFLKVHTKNQVIGGTLLGFVVALPIFYFYI